MRRPFTLIEILLVIVLCATAIGTIGISISGALRGERLESNASLCKEKLVFCSEVMRDFDTDLLLTFVPSQDGVKMLFVAGKNLPPHVLKLLHKNSTLSEVRTVLFNGKEEPLHFHSATSSTPQGRLTLMGKKNIEIVLNDFHEIKAPYPKEALSSS